MNLNDLNDDSLLAIFRYFSFAQRVHNEEVCTRWFKLLRTTFSNITDLNISEFFKTTYYTHYQQDNINFTPTIHGLIIRCGPYLRKISFGSRWLKVNQLVLDAITECCVKLETLDLSCTILNGDLEPTVAELAPKLIELNLEEVHFVSSECNQINRYFSKMPRLKRLNVRRTPFSMETLELVPADLEQINLNGARDLSIETLHTFLFTHTNLSELRLSSQQRVDQTSVEIICQINTIKCLEISYLNRDDLDLSYIGLLHQLEELYLQNNMSLDATSFAVICRQLSALRVLNTNTCKRLCDYRPLADCRQMVKFSTGFTTQICDEDLALLASNNHLQTITLISCYNITTDGVLDVARGCPLSEINVIQCPEVTDACLIALVDLQRPIATISIQGCHITNQGVRALAEFPERLAKLTELDISYNRTVGDEAVGVIHGALSAFYGQETPDRRLILYVHLTAVTKRMIAVVRNHINLVF